MCNTLLRLRQMNKENETVEKNIEYLKAMIGEAREQGLNQIANLFAEQLQTVIAMAKFDKGELD
jgi:hypothetical protein